MNNNADQKREVSDRFGKHAEGYAKSVGHAQGADLAILLHLLHAHASWRVLDVATGAGHTAAAIAPFVEEVVASDLSPGMVEQARKGFAAKGLTNVSAVERDVEDLQFADESFDAVTSRIAPHHFLDIDRAVGEMARVLKPGGVLVIEDNTAPQSELLDKFINDLEKQRDPTHVRSYSKREWEEMLAKHGLIVVRTRHYGKKHDMQDWIGRTDLTPDEQEALYDTLASAPQRARKHFKIESVDGKVVSFTDDKVILKAIKRTD
ncbi:MAG: methyltransferase domain-containing protein [Cyanobacteria bacterium REEB67]|nr:methyltransferase domain-containing protein [Cyanobacteria bacterium REEB67]